MAAAARAALLALALCAFQVSSDDSLPSFDDLQKDVANLQESIDAQLQGIYANITSAVGSEEAKLVAQVASSVASAQAQVDALIADAKAQGLPIADCSLAAAANLTRINAGLPVSLAKCSVAYLDAFNYYVLNVKNDFALMFQEVANGTQQALECSLDVACQWNVYYSVTVSLLHEQGDIALQIVNAQTAGVNLAATITKCDEEKSTQATLDALHVVSYTQECIKQKQQEVSAATST